MGDGWIDGWSDDNEEKIFYDSVNEVSIKKTSSPILNKKAFDVNKARGKNFQE